MLQNEQKFRTETDTFGPIQVPANHYWGAQTQRSLQNFKIGAQTMPAPLVHAFGAVKMAAAMANMKLGVLDQRLGKVIVAAAQEVYEGRWDKEFPLVVWHSGSG